MNKNDYKDYETYIRKVKCLGVEKHICRAYHVKSVSLGSTTALKDGAGRCEERREER